MRSIRSHAGLSERVLPYLLLIPAFAISGMVILGPVLNGIVMSFTDFSLIRQQLNFNDFANYRAIWVNPIYRLVFFNSILIVFVAVVFQLFFGLILALLLDSDLPGKDVFRSAIFIIWIIPMMVVSLLFFVLFNTEYGIINHLLRSLRVIPDNIAWFGRIWPARISLMVAYAWRGIPFFMVLLLAALQTVPTELVEAARIDGASSVQVFRFVKVPFIAPIGLLACLLSSFSLFQDITATFVMTNGGPVYSTTTVGLFIYKESFQNFRMGQAAAVGSVWLVFLAILAVIYVRSVGLNAVDE